MDPRARRTRDLLGDALVALMHEKPFKAISVQDVLERAGIARSTFYTHYRSKDDLFLSDADDFFEGLASHLSLCREASNRVAPVRELFAHIADARKFHDALVASGRFHDVLELARGHLARGIEQRLAELRPARARASAQGRAVAHALAGALLSLLSWWMGHGMAEPPQAMDELFHRLVWSGVSFPARPGG
jgi:AcrR family transcriptional regulator